MDAQTTRQGAAAGRGSEVDSDVVGRVGTVVTRIRGGDRPGEVGVTASGAPETFIPYCAVEPRACRAPG